MTIVSFITWVVFGAVVGCAARAVFAWVNPAATRRMPDSWAATVALGVVGSIVGGLPFGAGPAGLMGSILGAVAVVVVHSWYMEGNS
jgi:uncharacterized membrane protein YeaQ/YmgE (transglycosylase-associated protein family)